MSKHLSDGNKAKLLAFLQSRAAAGEQSLKTWGKQHKLLSHQAEQMADALVSEGLALREERASGFVWRAVARAEEPAAPASVLEDGDPPSAPRSRSKNGKSEEAAPGPELETASGFTPAPGPAIPPPAPESCLDCETHRGILENALEEARARVTTLGRERDNFREQLDAARRQISDHEGDWALLRGYLSLSDQADRQVVLDGVFGLVNKARAAGAPREPSADGDQLAQLLLDLPAEAFAAIAAARQDLTRARELLERGRALEEQALADLQAALTGKAPAPREAPSQGQPEGRQAIATWARRPSSAETGEREGTARDRVMRLFLARPDERLTSAEVGHALEVGAKAVTGPLSTLTTDGKLERVTTGLYQLSKTWARRVA